jgi:hypothetical protein
MLPADARRDHRTDTPICTSRLGSRPASKCRRTAAWCLGNISRARWTDAAESPNAARRCCARCWWNAPGAWCVTTPGREGCIGVSPAAVSGARSRRSSLWPARFSCVRGRCSATRSRGTIRRRLRNRRCRRRSSDARRSRSGVGKRRCKQRRPACHDTRLSLSPIPDFRTGSPRSYVLGSDASARSLVYPRRQATVSEGCP